MAAVTGKDTVLSAIATNQLNMFTKHTLVSFLLKIQQK